MRDKAARFLVGMVVGLAVAGPAFAQKPGPDAEDVVNKMMGVHKFDTMLSLMRVSDTVFMLKRSGPYTVFAPTDDAFAKMSPTALSILSNNKDAAKRFVMSHVVRGRLTAQQAVRMRWLKGLSGNRLSTGMFGGRGEVDGSSIEIANVMATNGMIQGLSSVGS